MANFLEWYNSIPSITKYWFITTTIVSLLGRFGMADPYFMLLDWEPFFYKLEIWRPFTALFYYPVTSQTGFRWLVLCNFLYTYSKNLESIHFAGVPADFLLMLLFNWICCTIICLVVGIYFLLEPMVMSVLYVWCKFNGDEIVTLWFGVKFKAMYLPWFLYAFNMILYGGGLTKLIGIFVGQLYYFLAYQNAQDIGGSAIIRVPEFLNNFDWENRSLLRRFGDVPPSRRPNNENNRGGDGGYEWGQGRTLDGN